MGHTIRAVRDGDSAALIDLVGTCWSEYPGCVLDVDGEEPWLRRPASAYRAWGGGFWVVDGSGAGALHGSAGFKPLPGTPLPGPAWCELKGVYVARAARRAGLGSALVRHAEDQAGAHGMAGVQAWSDSRFTQAHAMYLRLGYRRTGRSRELGDLSNTTEWEFAKAL